MPSEDLLAKYAQVAMVPQSGAVTAEGLVWNNALYDENDACHIALGQSYAVCYEGGSKMTEEERRSVGLNQSNLHVDFVVGSQELSVYGVRRDGSEEPIIVNGERGFET